MEWSWKRFIIWGSVLLGLSISHRADSVSTNGYTLITEWRMTWTEAQGYCRTVYRDLATVFSEEGIKDLNELSEDLDDAVWIGLYDDVNSWKWSLVGEYYYAGVSKDFRNWQHDQPDNAGAVEHCVSMKEDGFWRDNACAIVKMPSICFVDGAGDQYVLVTEEMTWVEAQIYCRRHHTDLLSVRSAAENEGVKGGVLGHGSVQEAWIGLRRGSWKWSDGSSLTFTAWDSGQPNNGNGSEACVSIQNGTFHDRDCATRFNFFCKGPLPSVVTTNQQTGPSHTVEAAMTAAVLQTGNVAPTGRATQSAPPASAETGPKMAIDEHPGPTSSHVTCATVPQQLNPLLRLDLQSIYRVNVVSVIAMGDCCHEQLNGAEIRIGLKADLSNPRCAVIATEAGQHKYIYQCGGMEGRFVHIVLPGHGKTLTLCEVQVYGTVLDYKKRSLVKISADFDMSEPLIQQQIQKQLETEMENRGISNLKIRWRISGKWVSHIGA